MRWVPLMEIVLVLDLAGRIEAQSYARGLTN